MRTLGAYVWKEWREFRAVAIGLLLAVPLLLAIAALALPDRAFADRDAGTMVATIAGLGAMLIALFAITTDLFAGEVRRGRMAFLGRLPAGLGQPFLAKALVFVVGVAGFFAYGYAAGAAAVAFRGGEAAGVAELLGRTMPDGSWRIGHETFWLSLLVLLALPVSCFAPRGVLTIPLTVVLGAAIVAVVPFMRRTLLDWAYAGGLRVLLLALPPVAGYLAFVRGYRAGGGWPRALKWAAVVLLLGCVYPALPRAQAFLAERGWLETREVLLEAYLGADGRHLYVARAGFYDGEESHAGVWLAPLRIDVGTGEFAEMDRRGLGPLGDWRRTRQPVPHPYLRYGDDVLDTRTAEVVSVPLREATLAVERAASHLVGADGRRLWVNGNRLEWEGGSVALGPALTGGRAHGVFLTSFSHDLLDPFRLRVFDLREHGLVGWPVFVRPGEWLVRSPFRRRNVEPRWMLYDPDARTCRDVPVEPGVAPIVLDDGTLLVRAETGEIDLVDPETGASRPVLFEDGSRAVAPLLFNAASGGGPQHAAVRDRAGRRVFTLKTRLARLEGARLVRTAETGAAFVRLIACGAGDSCYAHAGDEGLVQLEFGRDTVRTLYRTE